jgi:penicillin-binding protein 2
MIRRRGTDGLRRRLAALSVIASTGFLLVVGQLWYLQIREGPGLAERSERNRIRVRPLLAPRGTLYDRNLVPLAETEPSFTLSVIPRELEKRQAVLAQLAILLKVPIGQLEAPLRARAGDSGWPVALLRGLSFAEAIRVQERRGELPGVVVEVEPRRAYPSNRFAAHLLGYVRQPTPEAPRPGRSRGGGFAGQRGGRWPPRSQARSCWRSSGR